MKYQKENPDCSTEPCDAACGSDCVYQEHGIAGTALTADSDRMCRVVEELRLLLNVSRTLQDGPALNEIVRPVLRQMAESLGLYRGVVRILNRETGEIVIDEAFGLSAEEMAASRIRLGEGVIGQVAKSGKPVIIPDIEEAGQSLHPDCAGFSGQTLHRPGATAFLCVPIIHDSEVMGTLSGYRRCGEQDALAADQRLLIVTAQLIAQAARLRQTSRENLDALRQENDRLQEQIRKHFSPDNRRRCHGAKLNLVQCPGSLTRPAKMMERDDGIPWKRFSYFGIEDMSAALYEAAKFFSNDPTIMEHAPDVVREEGAAIYPELQKFREILWGKKAATSPASLSVTTTTNVRNP